MKNLRSLVLAAALLTLPGVVAAQKSLQFHATIGPYRVDDLAGTPLVPMVGFFKPVGTGALLGANLGLIKSAGFYGLNALTLDLHAGIRRQFSRAEIFGTIGPSAMAGGDGDGTPYVGLAGHATVGTTVWLSPHFGITGAATGRVWLSSGNSRFSPGATIGIALRR